MKSKALPETYRGLSVNCFIDAYSGQTVISLTNRKCTKSVAYYVLEGELFPYGNTDYCTKWYMHIRRLAKKAGLIP